MVVLSEAATDQYPYGADGPMLKAVDREVVRAEFYKSHPADGDTEQKRKEAKRKAFNRSIHDAADKELIGVRDINGVTVLWLTKLTEEQAAVGTPAISKGGAA
jgi:hypothetical protein